MFESQMQQGYPAKAEIDDYLEARAIELPGVTNPNPEVEFYQFLYGLIKSIEPFMALSVFAASATTFAVRGGHYHWGQAKELTTTEPIDPVDNDTTYVWLNDDNTIGSGIDGDGWPATPHVKLAEIDVDSAGVITDWRDLRGQSFMKVVS